MRLLLLLVFLLALDIYAFQAVRLLAQNWTAIVRTTVYAVYWAIPVIAIAMIVLSTRYDLASWNKTAFTLLRAFIFIAYFSKFVIVAILLVDDVRRLLGVVFDKLAGSGTYDPSRSRFLSQMAVFLGGLPFVALSYGILRNAYRYKIHRHTVPIKDLPESLQGLRILQISDIHSGSFTQKEPLREAVDLINAQQADIVFFTGDLVNNTADEMQPYVDIFSKIKAPYGVFSVLGNHDYGDYVGWSSPEAKQENMLQLYDTHRRLGWDLLLNENRLLDIRGEQVAIIGVENYSGSARFSKYGDLAKAYKGAESASLKLLLSHDPTHWDYQITKDFPDIAVTFSGHTHGMQFGVEIPGWIKWSPAQYVYKQWAGLYQQGQQFLYVNRGFGFLAYPGRVGILPEITVLELARG